MSCGDRCGPAQPSSSLHPKKEFVRVCVSVSQKPHHHQRRRLPKALSVRELPAADTPPPHALALAHTHKHRGLLLPFKTYPGTKRRIPPSSSLSQEEGYSSPLKHGLCPYVGTQAGVKEEGEGGEATAATFPSHILAASSSSSSSFCAHARRYILRDSFSRAAGEMLTHERGGERERL